MERKYPRATITTDTGHVIEPTVVHLKLEAPPPPTRQPEFTGTLTEPIDWKSPTVEHFLGDPASPEAKKAAERLWRLECNRVFDEMADKLPLLFEAYEIKPTSPQAFFDLSIALARHFVKGFWISDSSSGRPPFETKDNVSFVAQVIRKIEEHKSQGKPGHASEAIDALIVQARKKGSGPFHCRKDKDESAHLKTLENRFSRLRQDADLVRRAEHLNEYLHDAMQEDNSPK
jgi:hypothetical protein